jgi:hypothetical protein
MSEDSIRRRKKYILMRLECFERAAPRGAGNTRVVLFLAALVVVFAVCAATGVIAGGDDTRVAAPPAEAEVVYEEPELPALPEIDEADAELLAKLIWAEARGVKSEKERAAVAWCVFNRIDDAEFAGDTVHAVVTREGQFASIASAPALETHLAEARDTLIAYADEKEGTNRIGYGRTLPKQYVYFWGDGKRNYFKDKDGNVFVFED